MKGRPEVPIGGVVALDHTADIGLQVEAPDLPELFLRAALGTMWLLLERDLPAGSSEAGPIRSVELVEEDLGVLFRAWLRTLLFWEDSEGFVTRHAALSLAPVPHCSTADGQAFHLSARVEGVLDRGPRVREIKGVTLHGLRVEQEKDRWQGWVIFDV